MKRHPEWGGPIDWIIGVALVGTFTSGVLLGWW